MLSGYTNKCGFFKTAIELLDSDISNLMSTEGVGNTAVAFQITPTSEDFCSYTG